MTRLRAHAKLTLSLRIVGVQEDGYHLIDAEMATLDLCDELEIDERAEGAASTVVHVVDGEAEAVEDDLVARALDLCGRPAAVSVVKRIPAGGGLGGGSADAAAILRWAGHADLDEAASLGADVPFCLVGGRARVRGIGQVIEPLSPTEAAYTLLTPPIHCSTPEVYRQWDAMGGPAGDHGNDLEAAALAVAPDLAAARDRLAADTGLRPLLAGSGSTWFVEGAFPGDGRVVVNTVAARPGPTGQ